MDRQTAANLLDNLIGMVDDNQENDYDTALKMGIEALKTDIQPVQQGYWIDHPDDLFPEDSMIECSICHEYEYATANRNFCGNCGAKMDEDPDKGRKDVHPIVRCKYCKHSTEWYKNKRRCFLWLKDGISVSEDGYCNYWEGKGW